MMLMMEAVEGNWDDINMIVKAFQKATDRLEHCGVPVVTGQPIGWVRTRNPGAVLRPERGVADTVDIVSPKTG